MKTIYYILWIWLLWMPFTSFAQNCTVNAGIDMVMCISAPEKLNGNASGKFLITPHWVQIGGPSVSITNADSLATSCTNYMSNKLYTFKLAATCKDGYEVSDKVTINVSGMPRKVDAGSDQNLCIVNDTVALLHASLLDSGETGLWNLINPDYGKFLVQSSPTDTFIPNVKLCEVSPKIGLIWTVNKGACSLSDTLDVVFTGGVKVSAGPHQVVMCSDMARLDASCPGGAGQQGTWSIISGPAGSSFDHIHSPYTSLRNLQIGTYILKWEVTGLCVQGEDTVSVEVKSISAISTPNAGKNQGYCIYTLPSQFTLIGSPPASTETGKWVQIGGKAVTITNPDSTTTHITGIKGAGAYIFRWVIKKGECMSYANVSIYVSDDPQVNAGPDQTLPCGTNSIVLTPSKIGGTWSLEEGPCIPLFSSNKISKLNQTGIYKLKYVYANYCGIDSDYIGLNVSFKPSGANAGTNQQFACHVVAGSLAANIPPTGKGIWSLVSGDAGLLIQNVYNPSSEISGLKAGKYTLRWSVSNGKGCPPSESDVNIYVSTSLPQKANAGQDRLVCYNTPVQLEGNTPKPEDFGVWAQLAGKKILIDDIYNPSAILSQTEASEMYTLTWTISNACGVSIDTTIIKTTIKQGPSNANAGPDQCLPEESEVAYLRANKPQFGIGVWAMASGPSVAQINSPANDSTVVTGLVNGNYIFTWTIGTADCQGNTDSVVITIAKPTSQAWVDTDQFICAKTATLHGNTPEIGYGLWKQLAGPGGAHIADVSAPVTEVGNLTNGHYIFSWNIYNGACPATKDSLTIIKYNPDLYANAGVDFSMCGSDSAYLSGNRPLTGQGTWLSFGDNKPSIIDINNPNSLITNVPVGITKLVWMINDLSACEPSYDTVNIYNLPKSLAAVYRSQCEVSRINLSANEVGDHWGTWKQLSGPSCFIEEVNNPQTLVSNMRAGVYIFRWTVTSPGCETYSDLIVENRPLPTKAFAGEDQKVIYSNNCEIHLNANKIYNGEGHWQQIIGAEAHIVSPCGPRSWVTGLKPGRYVFRWHSSNKQCESFDDVKIKVIEDQSPASHSRQAILDTPAIYVPNAFTPNSNNLNDFFKPSTYLIDKYEMNIYDRWGNHVYSGTEANLGWNGTFKETICQDEVYIWVIVYSSTNNKDAPAGGVIKGTVTLLRGSQ